MTGRLGHCRQLLHLSIPISATSFHSSSAVLAKKKLRRDWAVPKGREMLKDSFGNDTAYAAPISNEKKKLNESLFGSYAPQDVSLNSESERSPRYRKASSRPGGPPSSSSSSSPPNAVTPLQPPSIFDTPSSSKSSRPASVRQLRMSRHLHEVLETLLSTTPILSTGLLSYRNVPIDVVEVNVSPDLRHATVVWDVPYSAEPGTELAVGEELERRIGEGGGGGGKLAEINVAARVKAQFSVRLRFVRAKEKEGVVDIDTMFDIIERDLKEDEEGGNSDDFDALEDVEERTTNSKP